jgi:hypothetical protein
MQNLFGAANKRTNYPMLIGFLLWSQAIQVIAIFKTRSPSTAKKGVPRQHQRRTQTLIRG